MLVISLCIIMRALSLGSGLRYELETHSMISDQHEIGKEWNPKWTIPFFSDALWKAQRALRHTSKTHKKLHGSVSWTRLKDKGRTITVYHNGSSSSSSKSRQRKSFSTKGFCSSFYESIKNFMAQLQQVRRIIFCSV